ncbi:MAG: AAA family ATPase [Anaerolineae bacterium]|nr:AAA family ATPase [Anaerolineae bacterium]
MSHLVLSLLGSFQATLDSAPITTFESDKVRALLAYLAVEHSRPQRREMLAGLLWPDMPERDARTNLRHVLANLRKAIGDRDAAQPVLLTGRQTLQFNVEADYGLDVQAFTDAIAATTAHIHTKLEDCETCVARLREAAGLHSGEFLAGFSLDSDLFEAWITTWREKLHIQALDVLDHLAAHAEQRGDYAEAIRYAQRQVDLEPWRESAHRQWMRALACSGQRGMALVQYEACRRILETELGIEPEAATTALYENIRRGELQPPVKSADTQSISSEPLGPVSDRVPLSPISPAPSAATPLLEGERRVVTLLLADLRGTAALSQYADTEAWAELITPALHLLGAEITRLGGSVEQYRRDGLTACFGGQVAHEDDPERAVLAALAMRKALAAYLAESNATDLSLTVSVHTGEVICTPIGDTTSMLSTVVESAEISQASLDPGTIWVSDETHRLVAPLFTWTFLGENGYEPLAHWPQVDKGRGIAGLSSPLVGRDTELQALRKVIERLRSGIGGIVTVVGEAGIGKSRLVAELHKSITLQSPNLQWIEGRCFSYATSSAYQVWRDMLHAWLDVPADAVTEEVVDTLRQRVRTVCPDAFSDVYPFLVWLLSLPLDAVATARLRGIEAEGLQVLTFRAVETLLETAAQQTPLVLVCEDLHWADAISLALLEHLLALTDRVLLLFVCIFRPERERGCWHIRELAARTYEHRHIDVRLKVLSSDESAQLVGNLLTIESLPPELRGRILERAEGNPFYVEEIVRSLIDNAIIIYDESTEQWHATQALGDFTLPDTLYGVLMARIDRLPVGAKRVLQLASVIGRIVSYSLLAAIAERSTLDAHLVTLQRARMMREQARLPERARVSERAFIFHHQFTLEAVYGGLLRRARRVLHRRVAEALETLYPEHIEENLGLFAYHWDRSGDVEQARNYLCRAAEQATAQFANAEAADYLERALALTPETLSTKRYDLLLNLEQLHDLQGLRELQLNDLDKLQALAQTLNDGTPTGAERLGEVYQRRAQHAYLLGKFDEAIVASQQTIRLATIARSVRLEALGHLIWARVLRSHNAQIEDTEAHLTEAITLARAERLDNIEAQALAEMGLLYSLLLHRFDQARSCLKRCFTLYQNLGDRLGMARAQGHIGASYLWQGDLVTARDYQMRALRLHYGIGNLREQGWVLEGLGETTVGLGLYAEGSAYLQRSQNTFQKVGEVFGEGYVLSYLTRVCLILGQYEEAGLCSERQLQIGQDLDDLGFRIVSNIWRSEMEFCQRNPETALEFGQRAFTEAQKGATWRKFDALLVIGQALAALGDLEEATVTYKRALEVGDKPGRRASALVGLANIYTHQGQITEALTYVNEVLCEIDTADLISQTLYPAGIYLMCYRVLKTAQDERGDAVLEKAHTLLQELAARIDDEVLRRSFLENVAAHRDIVTEWERVHTGVG